MMDNRTPIRWRLRLENFRRAVERLESACRLDEYSELERAGLVQTFEFSFELGWKTLKDLLDHEGYDDKTPREVIRRAFQAGYLDETDTTTWLDGLDKRNLLSHIYHEGIAREAERLIKERYHPLLRRLLDHLEEKAAKP
ncbi:MAG: nucleotidyltransferase [Deltaproteobacteria bacterium]|nr:MAG: nucleotidyltransferase [Deltaproteobacteria bacterium]